ncbi:MAG: response regulator [Deltaproteobacteria bacterium]|nr:response regulator [Deltaproteobacteria bacterium]
MADSQRDERGLDDDSVADLQDRLEVLTAFTGGIVFEFDREGTYLRVWTGDPALLARPASDLIGRNVAEVVSGPEGIAFQDVFRRVHDSGAPESFEYSLDVQAGRRIFSCEARAHERASGAGGRTVTLLVRDVTAAKELEGKLVQAERLAALGLLAASVGHEIRQPLAYLLASVDALGRAAPTTEGAAIASSLENVRKGASRIAEIVATLDTFARQRQRETTTFDVRRSLRAAIDLCASELDGRAEVAMEIVEPLPVRGDEGELTQVFANLLLNAAHAIAKRPPGAPLGHVAVRATKNDKTVRISVADDGTGISPEDRTRIFDPFFTTKEPGRGTGLGLFISRNIVVAHGGTLEVESTPGVGTTVFVSLVSAEPDGPRRTTSDVRPRAVTPRRRLSVLIVDDERRFLDSLRLVLDGIHDVVIENDARKAMTLVEADPVRFDVVLCDLSMPAFDGPAFHARMKELGVDGRFVLMTGGAYTPHAADFLQANACPRIEKPFRAEALLALLEEITRSRSAS